MQRDRLNIILEELRRRMEGLYGDRLLRMILYGSHARGEARQDSDIDVLLVLKGGVSPYEESTRTEFIVAELALQFDVAISCFFVSGQRYVNPDIPLLRNIEREGIAVGSPCSLGTRSGRSRPARLPVAQVHQPAQHKQGQQEGAEAIQPVDDALAVGALGDHAQHNRGEQRKQERGLEMGKVYLGHQFFFPTAIS
jgi:predicted nucleotidyltransferase